MSILNLPICLSPDTKFNTGRPLCDIKKSKLRGLIFLDRGTTFTPEQTENLATFLAALQEKVVAERGGRAYPLYDLLNFEDNTADRTTGSMGNLTTRTITTGEAVPLFLFGYDGSEIRHQRITEIEGIDVDVLFVDDKFAIYGCVKSNGNFGGYEVSEVYVNPSRFPVADAVNQYSFTLELANLDEYKKESRFIVTSSGILQSIGLINAQVLKLGEGENTVTVQVVADGGRVLTDADLFQAGIIAAGFTAKRADTGAAVVVSGAAPATEPGAITITYAGAGLPNGTKVTIIPPTAAELNEEDVYPYEFFGNVEATSQV